MSSGKMALARDTLDRTEWQSIQQGIYAYHMFLDYMACYSKLLPLSIPPLSSVCL